MLDLGRDCWSYFVAFTIGNSRLNLGLRVCARRILITKTRLLLDRPSFPKFRKQIANWAQTRWSVKMYNSRGLNEAAFDVGRISSDGGVEPNNHLGFSCVIQESLCLRVAALISSRFTSSFIKSLGGMDFPSFCFLFFFCCCSFHEKREFTREGLCKYNRLCFREGALWAKLGIGRGTLAYSSIRPTLLLSKDSVTLVVLCGLNLELGGNVPSKQLGASPPESSDQCAFLVATTLKLVIDRFNNLSLLHPLQATHTVYGARLSNAQPKQQRKKKL